MPDTDRGQPTMHALLIAVDYYKTGAKDWVELPEPQGLVRDVKGVEGFLKETMQVRCADHQTPVDQGRGPADCGLRSRPTRTWSPPSAS